LDRAGISWKAYLQSLPHAGVGGGLVRRSQDIGHAVSLANERNPLCWCTAEGSAKSDHFRNRGALPSSVIVLEMMSRSDVVIGIMSL